MLDTADILSSIRYPGLFGRSQPILKAQDYW